MKLVVGRAELPLKGEDVVLQNDELRLFGVFDGLGGHGSGDVAARMAARTIEVHFGEHADSLDTDVRAVEVMKGAFRRASDTLRGAVEHLPDVSQWMATTASVIHFFSREDGQVAPVIGHIGDSCIFHFAGGSIGQITTDEATRHGLTNSLSADRGDCRQARVVKSSGYNHERFVICSDGITQWYRDWALSDRFRKAFRGPDSQVIADNLVTLDPLMDDKSVIVIDWVKDV